MEVNIISPLIVTNTDRVIVLWLVECCFTSTETVGLSGTGAQDGHLDFYTAPKLCRFVAKPEGYIPIEQHVVQFSSRWYSRWYYWHSTPFLRSFLNVAFETVPIIIGSIERLVFLRLSRPSDRWS